MEETRDDEDVDLFVVYPEDYYDTLPNFQLTRRSQLMFEWLRAVTEDRPYTIDELTELIKRSSFKRNKFGPSSLISNLTNLWRVGMITKLARGYHGLSKRPIGVKWHVPKDR